ncbi:MAG: hypothetical protein HZA17_05730 [Nitrospirae bacterium]|nr:hypothetical protein [Nitrospirota bacterium]
MDLTSQITILLCLFSLTFMINLSFGFLRNKTKKYSLNWFLCIHLPIPFIILARVSSQLGFRYIPVFVLAAVFGQILGGKLEF